MAGYTGRLSNLFLWFAGVMVLVSVPGSVPARTEVTATAAVDSTDYLIGDWIDVEVRIEHPPGASFASTTGDTLGPFLVIGKREVRSVSSGESAIDFRIAVYDTGRITLPPIGFLCTIEGDTTAYPVSTAPVDLVIHPVPVDTTADIKDIKPPVSLAMTWREIVFPTLLVLAIAFLGWWIFRFMKNRKVEVREEAEPVDTRPPHVIALERLRIIEEKKLWQRGLLKPYYSEVTEVVRAYLEGRYGVPALEMTTGEILHHLRSVDIPDPVQDEIERMLGRADRVKFAKYEALPEENTETMTKAYTVVEATKESIEEVEGEPRDHGTG